MKNIDKIRQKLQKALEEEIKLIMENECPFHYDLKGLEDDEDRCSEYNNNKENCKICWNLETEE